MLTLTNNWRTCAAPEAVVHGTNLRGLRGTTLAAKARELNPCLERAEALADEVGEVVPGLVFPVPAMSFQPPVALLMVTRMDHQATPQMEDLAAALEGLRAYLVDAHSRRVAVAALGDGLPLDEVMALLFKALGDLPTQVLVQR